MFLTTEAFKHVLFSSLSADGSIYWRAVELALPRLWFIVDLLRDDIDDDASGEEGGTRSLLVAEIDDVLALSQPPDTGRTAIRSVTVILPNHTAGTKTWAIERVLAVWSPSQTKEPSKGVIEPLYLQTETGRIYESIPLGNERSDTDGMRLICRFP